MTRLQLHRVVATGTFVVVMVAAGCTGDDEPTTQPLPAELNPELVWASGGFEEEGGVSLTAPRAGVILSAGLVAVVDRLNANVAIVDSSGRQTGLIGARGEGPGEFRDAAEIGRHGPQSIWVTDNSNGRITTLSTDGRVLATVTRPSESVSGTFWTVRGNWLLDNGGVVGLARKPPGTRTEEAYQMPIVLWPPGEESYRVVDWVETRGHPALRIRTSLGLFHGTNQFIRSDPVMGTAPDGDWFFILDRQPATEPDQGQIRIHRYDSSGERLDVLQIAYSPVPVDEDVEEWVRARAGAVVRVIPTHSGTVAVEDVVAAAWIPDFLPPVRQAIADEDGYWLEREIANPMDLDQPARWERYDLDGALLGEVHLPRLFTPLAGSETSLLGWRPDSLETPVLEYYRLRYPTP